MNLTIPNTGRRVVLHIGMPGSGTSALQAAFALNRDSLATAGIDYPGHSTSAGGAHGPTTAGNASGLRQLLHRGHRDAAAGERALRHFLEQVDSSRATTILFSSEMLYHVKDDSDAVDRLRSELAARGIALQVVALVRNIATHAQTSYAMFVKAGGFSGTFASWIGSDGTPGRYECALRRNLEHYARAVGASNMSILHYDQEKSHLVRSVLVDAIGAPDDAELRIPPRPVNRRLTSKELRMMRYLNGRIAKPQTTRRLADIIMAREPFGDPYRSMRQADLDFLADKYDSQIDWVNQTFFAGSGALSIGSEDVEIVESAVEDLPLSDETLTSLDWLADFSNQEAR